MVAKKWPKPRAERDGIQRANEVCDAIERDLKQEQADERRREAALEPFRTVAADR
jgi:hypothetical protein